MRLRALLPLMALLAAAPAAAQQTQTFRSEGGFALDLPAGWTRLPDAAAEGARRSNAGSGTPINYDAVFGVSDAPWPAPPNVFVAWAELEKPTTPEEFGAPFREAGAQAELQAGIGGRKGGGRVDAPRWDAENGIAWVRRTLRSDGTSAVFVLMAMTLHPERDRMVSLVYYAAPDEDEARVRADLLAALRSLRVD
jgi:hypothetical protein